jgi:hypothetical protein
MKIFCSYAYTGEDADAVNRRMRLVVDTLKSGGHEAYCVRFDETTAKHHASHDMKGIFDTAFKNLAKNEAMVAIVTSPDRSVGQLMEIGATLSVQKPVYLFEHSSAAGSSYLPELVDKYFQWETEDDLKDALLKI